MTMVQVCCQKAPNSFSESADFINDKKPLKYSVEQVLGGTQVDENYLTRLAGQVGSKYLSYFYIVQFIYRRVGSKYFEHTLYNS